MTQYGYKYKFQLKKIAVTIYINISDSYCKNWQKVSILKNCSFFDLSSKSFHFQVEIRGLEYHKVLVLGLYGSINHIMRKK